VLPALPAMSAAAAAAAASASNPVAAAIVAPLRVMLRNSLLVFIFIDGCYFEVCTVERTESCLLSVTMIVSGAVALGG